MSTKISYIDQLRGIAILLVVLGHVIGYNNCKNGFSRRFVYSFHTLLFMFINGYVAQITFWIGNFGWNEVSSFMIKKFRTLLLPMITWGIVIPFFFLRSTAENNPVNYLLSYTKMQGGGLWFFTTFFFLSILFLLCRLIIKLVSPKSIVMDYVILSFLFVLIVLLYKPLPKDEIYSEGVRSVFSYSTFYSSGTIVYKQAKLRNLVLDNDLFFVFSSVMFCLLIPSSVYGISSIFNQLMKIALSLFTIPSLSFIARHISWNRQVDNMFQYFERESLSICVTHNGPSAFLLILFNYVTLSSADNILCFLFLSIFSLLICYASIWIKNIVSMSPVLELFLYGKSYEKKSI